MLRKNFCKSILILGAMTLPLLLNGCAARVGVGYRVYDPYYRDYHTWDDHEAVYYNQWAVETHHDAHKDFRKLNKSEQQDYFKWRHEHSDKH